jgi:hypothetical protein
MIRIGCHALEKVAAAQGTDNGQHVSHLHTQLGAPFQGYAGEAITLLGYGLLHQLKLEMGFALFHAAQNNLLG